MQQTISGPSPASTYANACRRSRRNSRSSLPSFSMITPCLQVADPAGEGGISWPDCAVSSAPGPVRRTTGSPSRHDDVLDVGHAGPAAAEASSEVLPIWRASMYAAYQSHQSCGGATASNEP